MSSKATTAHATFYSNYTTDTCAITLLLSLVESFLTEINSLFPDMLEAFKG